MAMKIKHNGSWITIPTGGENVINIEYSALKALADAGTLVKGLEYQITDFCTTVLDTADSRFTSLAKPFNVIVYAQTTKKLGMYAKAVPASEDTSYYFNNCALDKWILKYDLGGNYDWVSADGGATLPTGFTGTIYYMCDEYGNEAPFDFKNVTFKYTLNTYVGSATKVIVKNPVKNVTVGTTTYVAARCNSTNTSFSTQDLYIIDDGAGNVNIKHINLITFGTQVAITTYTPGTGGALDSIIVDSVKYERWTGKDLCASVSGSLYYYAWVNDEGEYVYTQTLTITEGTTLAYSNITNFDLEDMETIAIQAQSTNKFPLIGTNDGTTLVDATLDGTAAKNVIKSQAGNKDKFPYVYLGAVANNTKVSATSNNISVIANKSANLEFKGNEYITLVAVNQQTDEVVDNYTFIANYGGDSTESQAFKVDYDLAVETLVGNDNYGNVVAKNVLAATRNFYQRNEPLEANEGDLWFTIED